MKKDYKAKNVKVYVGDKELKGYINSDFVEVDSSFRLEKEEKKNEVWLLKSQPFQDFIYDCDKCKHFSTNALRHPSGDCIKHGFSCGYGFTCEDFTETEPHTDIKKEIDKVKLDEHKSTHKHSK